jgi:hypothetical protein
MSGKLNPYQAKLVFEWKNEEVIVEFTNPERPKIQGKIKDIDVHRNGFIIKTSEGDEVLVLGGIRCITKPGPDYVPEIIPETIRKEYPSAMKS